jgi:adenylylsulfate kinase
MILQFCGLSGAGKTTLARMVQHQLRKEGFLIEILDGDEYRKTLCNDLGFSQKDRHRNMLRIAFVANQLSRYGVISLISAINPYDATRNEIRRTYRNVKTVHVDCPIPALIKRDTKGLYRKALLPDGHPEKIQNLTGINDTFEVPLNPDLYLNTSEESKEECALQIVHFIKDELAAPKQKRVFNTIAEPSYQ